MVLLTKILNSATSYEVGRLRRAVQLAIAREKELKGWRREKKLDLIRSFNSNFEFLNQRFVKPDEIPPLSE